MEAQVGMALVGAVMVPMAVELAVLGMHIDQKLSWRARLEAYLQQWIYCCRDKCQQPVRNVLATRLVC
jgi:hypothetical protein